jgi:hypothetical protein
LGIKQEVGIQKKGILVEILFIDKKKGYGYKKSIIRDKISFS